jgi:hypothetical protein
MTKVKETERGGIVGVSDRCMKGMVFKDLVMYSIKKIKINQHKI